MQKGFLKDYLSFTRKERNAVLILAVFISLFFLVPHIIPPPPPVVADTLIQKQAAGINEFKDSGYVKKKYPQYPKREYEYRPYKPNNKEYPKRIYPAYPRYDPASKAPTPPKMIDINKADSSDLLPLPGIGYKLASRIINYRTKLGGFYKIEQVGETYGVSDSTFQLIKARLKISEEGIVRIDLNTADVNILKQHPYIRWNIANAILQYRKQHGSFKEVNDLLRINIITPEILEKIAPYCLISVGMD